MQPASMQPWARCKACCAMGKRRAALALALAALVCGAAAPTTIFDSYKVALLARKIPANMEFEYTVTRSGPNRIVTEQHRVYWTNAGLERNDTIAVNGTPVIPARSRMLRRSVWPYDVAQFAVSTDDYDVAAAGVEFVAGRKGYAFTLTRAASADFTLKSILIDAKTRLPLRETFSVAGSDCQASGTIEFGTTAGYWLPNFVSVVCTGAPQVNAPAPIYKESIRFSNYSFPAAIPPDIFGATSAGEQP
jgi:hypothetical protein